jgi:hypothetical protein
MGKVLFNHAKTVEELCGLSEMYGRSKIVQLAFLAYISLYARHTMDVVNTLLDDESTISSRLRREVLSVRYVNRHASVIRYYDH